MTPDQWPDTAEEMRQLSPDGFEEFVAAVWDARGFDTTVTQSSNDAGKDVVAKKGDRRIAIQAKRYSASNRVGGPEVQQYSSLLHDETIDDVVIVTSGRFTNAAYRRAQEIGIDLVDGDRLLTLADRYASNGSTSSDNQSSSSSDSNLIQFILLPFKFLLFIYGIMFKFLYVMYVKPLKYLFGSNGDSD